MIEIRPASIDDCLAIAELGLIAGEGIPGYFWADSQQPGQTLVEAGAELARSENASFSYRNALLAWYDGRVAAMMMAYRLPAAEDNDEKIEDYPEFVQPLVELEHCVPQSFYINLLAAYPQFRGRGVGTELVRQADRLAHLAGCSLISIEVFAGNSAAIRFYSRLGFEIADSRAMVESDYLPAGDVLLMTRPAAF